MPLYEFSCSRCGPFEERRSFEDAAAPASCPACATTAARVFGAPWSRRMPALRASVHERNEKSRHEPARMTRAERDRAFGGQPSHHGHRHGPSRPWQVGH